MRMSTQRSGTGLGGESTAAADDASSLAGLGFEQISECEAMSEPALGWRRDAGDGLLLVPVLICVGLIVFMLLTTPTSVVDARPAAEVCQRGGALC